MRIAASCVVLAALSSPAFADRGSGAAFDFGFVHSRIAVTDHTALDANGGRFGIRVASSRHFHFGAEVEEGVLQGTSTLPDGVVARSTEPGSTPPPPTTVHPLDGNALELKAYAGLHTSRGRIQFGGDAAFGVRDTWVSGDSGEDIAGRKKEPLIQARARVEAFVTDSTTIGAVASTDLLEQRNVSLGFVVSMNFTSLEL
jgi:hypothetical protein